MIVVNELRKIIKLFICFKNKMLLPLKLLDKPGLERFRQHRRQEKFTHAKFSKYINVNVKTKKKDGKNPCDRIRFRAKNSPYR